MTVNCISTGWLAPSSFLTWKPLICRLSGVAVLVGVRVMVNVCVLVGVLVGVPVFVDVGVIVGVLVDV